MEQTPVNYEATKEDSIHTVDTMIATEQCLVKAHMNTSKFLNVIKEANVLEDYGGYLDWECPECGWIYSRMDEYEPHSVGLTTARTVARG